MEKHVFTEVDDCILAAYRHVKTTSTKVKSYHELDSTGSQKTLGLESEDGHLFMITFISHCSSQKRSLARQIIGSDISVADFVNRQLMIWL